MLMLKTMTDSVVDGVRDSVQLLADSVHLLADLVHLLADLALLEDMVLLVFLHKIFRKT